MRHSNCNHNHLAGHIKTTLVHQGNSIVLQPTSTRLVWFACLLPPLPLPLPPFPCCLLCCLVCLLPCFLSQAVTTNQTTIPIVWSHTRTHLSIVSSAQRQQQHGRQATERVNNTSTRVQVPPRAAFCDVTCWELPQTTSYSKATAKQHTSIFVASTCKQQQADVQPETPTTPQQPPLLLFFFFLLLLLSHLAVALLPHTPNHGGHYNNCR